MVLRNSVQCLNCNQSIISTHRHDFVRCDCGQSFVDGGTFYHRWGGNCVSTCIYDNGSHNLRRNVLTWGRNYDENMNRLSKTEWILIKNLEYAHIEAILRTQPQLKGSFYEEILMTELIYRDLVKYLKPIKK